MIYRMAYDPETGIIGNFYPLDVDYGDASPAHFVCIDETFYHVVNAGRDFWRVNPETLAIYQYTAPDLPFEERRLRKKLEIQSLSDQFIYNLKQGYTLAEVDSWAKQEAGARALIADPDSTSDDAQFVRDMAAAREVPVINLAQRILTNVATADKIISKALGHMQKLTDMADAINADSPTALEDLEAIQWPDDPLTLFTATAATA